MSLAEELLADLEDEGDDGGDELLEAAYAERNLDTVTGKVEPGEQPMETDQDNLLLLKGKEIIN